MALKKGSSDSMSSDASFSSQELGGKSFKQGNRYCWGGLALWAFILICVLTFLAIFAAVMTPVIMLPLASKQVQHILDETQFVVVALHTVDENFLVQPPFKIVEATLEIRNIDSHGEGAQVQPTQVDLALDGVVWGNLALPYVDLTAPVTSVTTTTALFVTDFAVAAQALQCPVTRQCVWTVVGEVVIKTQLAATTLFYGNDFKNKDVSFEIPPPASA